MKLISKRFCFRACVKTQFDSEFCQYDTVINFFAVDIDIFVHKVYLVFFIRIYRPKFSDQGANVIVFVNLGMP